MDWLEQNGEELVLSSIVLGELRFYVAIQPLGKRRDKAEQILTAIDARSGSRFVDFDSRDAQIYGDLMARLRALGKPIPALDGQIAAQALARGYAVATRNIKDFVNAGMKVVNPWEA